MADNVSGTAFYFHASVYSFDNDASEDIIRHFERKINDPAARIWYDARETQQFCVICPSDLGLTADQLLHDTIEEYVENELIAAEGDEHVPKILPISESTDSSKNKEDNLQAGDASVKLSATTDEGARTALRPTHLFCMGSSFSSQVQLFHIHQLPTTFLDRILCPSGERAAKLLSQGLTARLVRATTDNRYIFNGRLGAFIPAEVGSTTMTNKPPFPTLQDDRFRSTTHEDSKDEAASTTEDTVVSQWLQEVTNTTQIEPNADPEIPKGAKSNLNGLANTSRRSRVPKGHTLFGKVSTEQNPDRTQNISSIQVSVPGTQLAFNNESDDDSDFHSAVTTLELTGLDSEEKSKDDLIHDTQTRIADGPGLSTIAPAPPSVSIEGDKSIWLSAYDEGFAVVDTIGLTANKVSVAKWQNENCIKLHKAPSRPVALRSAQNSQKELRSEASITRNSSDHSNLHNYYNMSRNRSKSSVGPTQQEPFWSRKPVMSNVSQDIVLECDHDQPVALPKTARIVDPSSPKETRDVNQTATGEATSKSAMTASARFLSQGHQTPPCDPSHVELDALYLSSSSDDEVVERKLEMQYTKPVCKTTMQQKARSKKPPKRAFQGQGTPLPNVELPLPDPLPVPKAVSTQQTPEVSTKSTTAFKTTNTRHSQRTPHDTLQHGTVQRSQATSQRSQLTPTHVGGIGPIVELLRDWQEDLQVKPYPILSQESYTLTAQIGTILLRSKNKKLESHRFTHDDLEAKLADHRADFSATNFLPRLTTTASDMDYLIRLRGSENVCSTSSELFYDIAICEKITGCRTTIIVTADKKKVYTIKLASTPKREAYLHYPGHVFDLHLLLAKPANEHNCSAVTPEMKDFISSMHTTEEPPSFEAHVASQHITVERVLAKRRHTCILPSSDMKLLVTETQVLDLVSSYVEEKPSYSDDLGRISVPQYNLKALSACHKDLVDRHRLWWEAEFTIFDLAETQTLQADVSFLDFAVRNADGIGFENQGPYVKSSTAMTEQEVLESAFW